MLNYIWGFMIIIGVAYGAYTGNMPEVSNAALDSSKEAVTLCITMLGVMSLWTGIMEIAREAGLIDQLTRGIRPIVRYLYPNIPKDHEANEYISTNMIANMLGLGWAATPAGLKAMSALAQLNKHSTIASREMCMLLIINISSLQLIPVNIIAYRSQYGSINPSSIIVPGLIATCFSTIIGVLFAKIMERRG